MSQITITEALAELNTIEKRLEKKQAFVTAFLTRAEGLKDPLEKAGGSVERLRAERQAITDLGKRHLTIRMAIQKTNHATIIKIGEQSLSVAEWLTWRKEVAPKAQQFLTIINRQLAQVRAQAQQRGATVTAAGTSTDLKPQDIIVNVNEDELAKELEGYEEVLGTLDGRLSLVNATTLLEL